ncbi:unnamed protein product [Vitrella brassicaformis CCMP3155]|uniref:PPPDE domain-containing protein n=2 Tax=Vitrella brassicaformis TaxID=1169539 RepID=A0A0G4EKV6_VITBC|nr:unnamed protein product [Vitrella brassicaformis CCMP3155]|eukprot:CEL97401.1 unnamed protein product [Vitrella brassicaformis CCMP3155]
MKYPSPDEQLGHSVSHLPTSRSSSSAGEEIRQCGSSASAAVGGVQGGSPSADGARVFLNVYDLTNGCVKFNDVALRIGTGMYHTGVEVYGVEYAFCKTECSEPAIFSCEPGEAPEHVFREKIDMGRTSMTEGQVKDSMERMGHRWKGHSYDLVYKNCITFAEEFCLVLGVGALPVWVTSASSTAKGFLETCTTCEHNIRHVSGIVGQQLAIGLQTTVTVFGEVLSGAQQGLQTIAESEGMRAFLESWDAGLQAVREKIEGTQVIKALTGTRDKDENTSQRHTAAANVPFPSPVEGISLLHSRNQGATLTTQSSASLTTYDRPLAPLPTQPRFYTADGVMVEEAMPPNRTHDDYRPPLVFDRQEQPSGVGVGEVGARGGNRVVERGKGRGVHLLTRSTRIPSLLTAEEEGANEQAVRGGREGWAEGEDDGRGLGMMHASLARGGG